MLKKDTDGKYYYIGRDKTTPWLTIKCSSKGFGRLNIGKTSFAFPREFVGAKVKINFEFEPNSLKLKVQK